VLQAAAGRPEPCQTRNADIRKTDLDGWRSQASNPTWSVRALPICGIRVREAPFHRV